MPPAVQPFASGTASRPRRQWVVVLRGAEVEVTDGSRRTFGPGDLLRADDTEGTGHITKPVGDPPIEGLFLPG